MTDLAEYVRESNAIEGIFASPGSPEWDDHMAAAEYARDHPGRAIAYPRRIHAILMQHADKLPGEYRRPTYADRGASFRTGNVIVGGERKMDWQDVPAAMAALTQRARSYPQRQGFWNVEELWPLHYEFERIHPFLDGNGRTGRLWLNALRQRCGFEWVIVRAAEREAYYGAIRAYERSVTKGL